MKFAALCSTATEHSGGRGFRPRRPEAIARSAAGHRGHLAAGGRSLTCGESRVTWRASTSRWARPSSTSPGGQHVIGRAKPAFLQELRRVVSVLGRSIRPKPMRPVPPPFSRSSARSGSRWSRVQWRA
jgi:hypothetical protein